MSSNHLRFKNSQNNIRFSLKVSPTKKDLPSCQLQRENIARRTSCFPTLTQHSGAGRSINLPPVEQKMPTPKSCSAVDLLQLANVFSKTKGSHENRRLSRVSADSLTRPTVSSIQKQLRFETSVNSAPDTCLKQKQSRVARHFTSKEPFCLTTSDEKIPQFAKSWPLAPLEQNTDATRLPQVCLRDEKQKNQSFKGSLAQFNKSRCFRNKQAIIIQEDYQPVMATQNVIEIPSAKSCNKSSKDSSLPSSGSEGEHLTVDAVAAHKATRSCEKSNCSHLKNTAEQIGPNSDSSEESHFTKVTEESVKVHPEKNEVNEITLNRIEDEDSRELDRRCLKWLDDVARERTQNPDKIFLPHLLMS